MKQVMLSSSQVLKIIQKATFGKKKKEKEKGKVQCVWKEQGCILRKKCFGVWCIFIDRALSGICKADDVNKYLDQIKMKNKNE